MQLHSLIFEAVNSLRQRKCRPERESIAHYVTKKSTTTTGPGSIKFEDVYTELENVVDSGKLLKVEFKGRTSYRIPESFSGSPLLNKHSKILNSSRTTGSILSVVSELCSDSNESYSTEGIEIDTIVQKLVELDGKRFTQENSKGFIDREVTVGSLVYGPKNSESQDRLFFPKDLKNQVDADANAAEENIEESSTPAPTPKNQRKMRGKKAAAASSSSTAPNLTPAIPIPSSAPGPSSTATAEEILAVKSSPPAVFRAYGRKSASFVTDSRSVNEAFQTPSEKNEMPVLENEQQNGADQSTESPSTSTTGRGVRNKRKKEVFDPSDVKPIKKQAITPTTTPAATAVVAEPKQSGKGGRGSSSAAPVPPVTPPPATRKSMSGRKRKIEEKVEEKATSAPAPAAQVVVTTKLPPETCDHCKRNKNSKGQFEQFLHCSECNSKKYHPSCLNYTKDQGSELVTSGEWKCNDCKICEICKSTLGNDETIKDIGCSNPNCATTTPVHTKCSIQDSDSDKVVWFCTPTCQKIVEEAKAKEAIAEKEPEKSGVDSEETEAPKVESVPTAGEKRRGRPPKKRIISLTLNQQSAPTTPKKSKSKSPEPELPSSPPPCLEPQVEVTVTPVSPKESQNVPAAPETPAISVAPTSAPTIPDPSMLNPAHWTPAQVELYFRKHGLHDEGSLFKEQEIDGLSLLLMRRQDIVHGPMKLLLGPALKVYKIVGELQQSTR